MSARNEGRRGARVATAFLVAIEGVDREPALRSGDISTTGVYFETDHDAGDVGTIHWLQIVSADGAAAAHVMAYVVRTVAMADARGRRLRGVAFEFMPESDEAAAKLHDLVRYVLVLRRAGGADPHIEPRVESRGGAKGTRAEPVTVSKLSVRSMVLETSFAIEPGETVRVDIVAPGMTRRIRLDGRAVRVAEKPSSGKGYAIEVEVQEETERPIRLHSSMTMEAVRPEAMAPLPPPRAPSPSTPDDVDATRTLDDLLSVLILPPEEEASHASRCHHLSGQLARVRLPTLLSLFDMERMTGRLVLARGGEEVRVYVREGQIVDVEPLGAGIAPRGRIAQLLAWDDGSFEFYVEPVATPDRVNVRTTALLLDLAREEDEAKAR